MPWAASAFDLLICVEGQPVFELKMVGVVAWLELGKFCWGLESSLEPFN